MAFERPYAKADINPGDSMNNSQEDSMTETKADKPEAVEATETATADSSEKADGTLPLEKERKLAKNVTGRTRFIATVPSAGLLIASFVLAVGTLISVVFASYDYIIGETTLHDLTVEYVECADSFLLAVALYILSIGLTSLFVTNSIPLPSWLEFHDFDDLKERFTSVVIVMIGVFFLGHVLKDVRGIDTLWLGLGCGAIIIALSVFMWTVFKSDE